MRDLSYSGIMMDILLYGGRRLISPAQYRQICRKNLRNFTIFSLNSSCANIVECANIAEFAKIAEIFWHLYLESLFESHEWRHFQNWPSQI
jgi:hypothetical protein